MALTAQFNKRVRKLIDGLTDVDGARARKSVRRSARDLISLAPDEPRRRLCEDVAQLLERSSELDTGEPEIATRILKHAIKQPDRKAEKIICPRYGLLWICVPKVASRSFIATLQRDEIGGELIKGSTIEDVLKARPEAVDYFKFCFVRNPFDRLYSFYEDKLLNLNEKKRALFVGAFYGLREEMPFSEFCRWLDSPYGANEFADRHYLPQCLQLVEDENASDLGVDFVGKFESFAEDFEELRKRVGLPETKLPYLNTASGWRVDAQEFERKRNRYVEHYDDESAEIVSRRYRSDFERFGYDNRLSSGS